MADPKFFLTVEERQSATWRRLLSELRRRRDELRRKNDHPADQATTANTRGQIAELTRMIALDESELPDE